jgi:hypothetical protein
MSAVLPIVQALVGVTPPDMFTRWINDVIE